MTVIATLIDMPTTIKGYTIVNEDGSYNVFLNSKMTQEQHLITYAHELAHIVDNDFGKEDVQDIEVEAHN